MLAANNTKILITGGNGYIATALYNNLKNNFKVTKITKKDFNLIDDYETNNFFKDKYYDVVIHTASVGGNRLIGNDKTTLQTNIKMFCNILANKNCYNKFISFGSGAEKYATNTAYGKSKSIIAQTIKEEDKHYNIRIYAVFDENELSTRFIKSNILRYNSKTPLIIHKDKFMDFFYMNDLIKLVTWYIQENNPPKEIDCTYSKKFKLTDIANMINNLSNTKVPVQIAKEGLHQPYTGEYTNLDIEYIDLEEGIKKTYIKFLKNI